jgi:hypothetical protein
MFGENSEKVLETVEFNYTDVQSKPKVSSMNKFRQTISLKFVDVQKAEDFQLLSNSLKQNLSQSNSQVKRYLRQQSKSQQDLLYNLYVN